MSERYGPLPKVNWEAERLREELMSEVYRHGLARAVELLKAAPGPLVGRRVNAPLDGYQGVVTHQYGGVVVIDGRWEVSASGVEVLA